MLPIIIIVPLWLNFGNLALANTSDGDGDCYCDDNSDCFDSVNPDCVVLAPGDCDDTDPSLNPDTPWYVDADGDGYGVPLVEFSEYFGLSAGGEHNCALIDVTNAIGCWGNDDDGVVSSAPSGPHYTRLQTRTQRRSRLRLRNKAASR